MMKRLFQINNNLKHVTEPYFINFLISLFSIQFMRITEKRTPLSWFWSHQATNERPSATSHLTKTRATLAASVLAKWLSLNGWSVCISSKGPLLTLRANPDTCNLELLCIGNGGQWGIMLLLRNFIKCLGSTIKGRLLSY